jgi:hypothetical protein
MVEKFKMRFPDGRFVELEVPPSKVDPNHPLLLDLQTQLLRLHPEEQLKLPHDHFNAVSEDPLELTIVPEMAMACGCNSRMDELISENPPVRGYVFTRRDDVPLLHWVEPEGGTQ